LNEEKALGTRLGISVYIPANGGPIAIVNDKKNNQNPNDLERAWSGTQVNMRELMDVAADPSARPKMTKYTIRRI